MNTVVAKKVFPKPPFREINQSDVDKEFTNELQPINHIDLSYLIDLNNKNRYVFVYELDEKILAFMTFLDKENHFHLDLIEANRAFYQYKSLRAGFLLITLLENISKNLGFSKITLHSVQDRISYYNNLGYVVTGKPTYHSDYGNLSPMQKTL